MHQGKYDAYSYWRVGDDKDCWRAKIITFSFFIGICGTAPRASDTKIETRRSEYDVLRLEGILNSPTNPTKNFEAFSSLGRIRHSVSWAVMGEVKVILRSRPADEHPRKAKKSVFVRRARQGQGIVWCSLCRERAQRNICTHPKARGIDCAQ